MRISDWSSDVCSSDLIASDHDLALAELLHIDDGAQTTPDKPLDFLRPTRLLALRRLARAARMRRAGQHAIFGGHPARALAAHPRRHLLVDAGGHQNLGVAKADEDAALGVNGELGFESDGTHLIGRAAGRAHKLSFRLRSEEHTSELQSLMRNS